MAILIYIEIDLTRKVIEFHRKFLLIVKCDMFGISVHVWYKCDYCILVHDNLNCILGTCKLFTLPRMHCRQLEKGNYHPVLRGLRNKAQVSKHLAYELARDAKCFAQKHREIV